MKSLAYNPRMLRLVKITIGLFVLASTTLLLFSFQQGSRNLEPIRKMGEDYTAKKKNHALVVGVIDGETTQVLNFGRLDRSMKSSPNEHTVFQIGELTGLLTSTLLLDVAAEGEVKIDDEVKQYFPRHWNIPIYQKQVCEHRIVTAPSILIEDNMYYRTVCYPDTSAPELELSLCNLSTHGTGLPNTLDGFYEEPFHRKRRKTYEEYTLENIQLSMEGYCLPFVPASQYHYSSIGIGLLGQALASHEKSDFETLLNTRLSNCLGMSSTTTLAANVNVGQLAPGHDKRGKTVSRKPYFALEPAIGGYSSLHDLLLFAQTHLGLDDVECSEVWQEGHEPNIYINETRSAGMGWMIDRGTAIPATVLWRTGKTNGYSCYLAIVPEHKTGIVLLSNSTNSVQEIGLEMLEELFAQKK